MNAITQNRYTEAWREIGKNLPKPKAILMVSAHWYVPGTLVTAMPNPRTIHDFGGFPDELFQFEYPAPGSLELANRVRELLGLPASALDQRWGLDHGTWSVLCHVFPNADVPVVQLSIDEGQPGEFHYNLAKKLQPLREEGVLVLGSGNLVHNLHAYAWGQHQPQAYDWAVRFEKQARELMTSGDAIALADYEALGKDAHLSVPTPDHFLPLLYILGLQHKGENVGFPIEGIDGGSISMLTVSIQ